MGAWWGLSRNALSVMLLLATVCCRSRHACLQACPAASLKSCSCLQGCCLSRLRWRATHLLGCWGSRPKMRSRTSSSRHAKLSGAAAFWVG